MATAARKSIGIRELRIKAGRVLRRVNEKRESVDITYRGQVIARIVPVTLDGEANSSPAATWDDIDRLAAEIGKHLNASGKSAAEIISEDRR